MFQLYIIISNLKVKKNIQCKVIPSPLKNIHFYKYNMKKKYIYIYIVVVQYLYHTMAMKYNLHMYTFYQAAIISARHFTY